MQSDAQERWHEAREWMRRRVDNVLRQNAGIPSPQRETQVDWILDRVFKDEYLALLTDSWAVWRQDDNANHFVVRSGLTYQEAKALVQELEGRGHKQFYWCRPAEMTVPETDGSMR
jgi:hypothetical protein